MSGSTTAIWHDVECGGYAADLPLWEELAERHGGPVLELGCGTGRVALHLARRGHLLYGLDHDPELIAALGERAADLSPSGVGQESDAFARVGLEGVCADAAAFELPEPVALALAPMQFLQLLAEREQRLACLRCVAASLRTGGIFAAAIVERLPAPTGDLPPLPDVREIDDWIYSSLPTLAEPAGEQIVLRRLRQTVSPGGELSEEENEILLQALPAATLEIEARSVGLSPLKRHLILETEDHVGSAVLLFERSA